MITAIQGDTKIKVKADITPLYNVRPDLCFATRHVMVTFQVVHFWTFCKISNSPIVTTNSLTSNPIWSKNLLAQFLKWAKWYWACKTLIVGNGAGSQQDSPQTTRLRLSPDAVALCQVRSNSFEEVDPHHNLGKYAWSVTNSEEKRLVFWVGKL